MDAQLEILEERMMLSAAVANAAIWQLLPNESTLTSPSFSDLWHLQNTGQTLHNPVLGPATGTPNADIDAVRAWDLTTGKHSVIVAVLDTGMDWTHPDLTANLFHEHLAMKFREMELMMTGTGWWDDVRGWNFVDNNGDTTDSGGARDDAVAGSDRGGGEQWEGNCGRSPGMCRSCR